MKFNYKKIASVFASAVMLTSTMGFAAAATYPAPFTDGAAVVYGTNAGPTDATAAIDVFVQLKDRVSGSTDASVSGDAKAIETSSQPLYMGDFMNNTKTIFTKDDLKTVLSSGKVTDIDGKDYTYELKINTPNTKVLYGPTVDNLALPIPYVDFDGTGFKFSLKIVFPSSINVTKLADASINLFGKTYVFSGNAADLTTTTATLYEKSTPVIVNDGESKTVDAHTISIAVEDATKVAITVDGVTQSRTEGTSGKVNGVDIYVKNVVGPNVAGTSRYAELYLNSNKVILTNADQVTLGADAIAGTNVTMTTAGGKVSDITIDIIPRSFESPKKYLKKGDTLVDPFLKTVKLELSALTPDLTADTKDNILIKPSGEKKASIKFTNKAGKVYDMDMLNASNKGELNQTFNNYRVTTGTNGTLTYYATELAVDNYPLVSDTTNVTEGGYVITCSNEYSQIWQLESILSPTTTNPTYRVRLKDQGSGSETLDPISLTGSGATLTGGLNLADGSTATLTMSTATNASVSVSAGCSRLYTKGGAMIDLYYADAPNSNLSQVRIVEDTSYDGGSFRDNGLNQLGENVTVRLGYVTTARSGRDMIVYDVMGGATAATNVWSDDVGEYDYYWLTKWGTFVKRTGDTDKQVEIFYPSSAMKVGVYMGEVSSSITPGTTGTGGGQISIVKDIDVDSVNTKNLFVVGGSCVNTVAAKILGSDTPLCAEDFTAATKVTAGGYIIKVVKASAAISGGSDTKVAMLVAGYHAADTTSAVKRAMVIDGVKTDVGSEEIFPVTA